MKKLNKLLLLLAIPFLVTSCLVDDELDNGLAESKYIVGFKDNVAVESYFSDIGAIQKEYPLEVLGGNAGLATTTNNVVSYVVDTAASSATEGVEFDFVNTSGQLTIPAGSSFAMFPLLINTGGFNLTQPTVLVLKLTSLSDSNSVISANHETLTVTFVGCQSTVNASMYSLLVTRDDGATYNQGTEAITLTSVNNFKTVTTGGWAAGAIAPPDQGFNFVDICGKITVPNQGLCQNYYSNQVTGVTGTNGAHGEVLANGDIKISYKITFTAGDRTYTNYYTKQ